MSGGYRYNPSDETCNRLILICITVISSVNIIVPACLSSLDKLGPDWVAITLFVASGVALIVSIVGIVCWCYYGKHVWTIYETCPLFWCITAWIIDIIMMTFYSFSSKYGSTYEDAGREHLYKYYLAWGWIAIIVSSIFIVWILVQECCLQMIKDKADTLHRLHDGYNNEASSKRSKTDPVRTDIEENGTTKTDSNPTSTDNITNASSADNTKTNSTTDNIHVNPEGNTKTNTISDSAKTNSISENIVHVNTEGSTKTNSVSDSTIQVNLSPKDNTQTNSEDNTKTKFMSNSTVNTNLSPKDDTGTNMIPIDNNTTVHIDFYK